jgi:hypothetical protein
MKDRAFQIVCMTMFFLLLAVSVFAGRLQRENENLRGLNQALTEEADRHFAERLGIEGEMVHCNRDRTGLALTLWAIEQQIDMSELELPGDGE